MGFLCRKGSFNPNTAIHLSNGVTAVILINRKKEVFNCYVDTKDYEKIKDYHWGVAKGRYTFYADNAVTGVQMHRLLNPDWPIVDHEDGNGLNNRRSNLREATCQQNNFNARKSRKGTSVFKGVSWERSHKSWKARIRFNGKLIVLGRFKIEKDAAEAYNLAAKKYFGEWAVLNNLEA
jgi:hypothetical protein